MWSLTSDLLLMRISSGCSVPFHALTRETSEDDRVERRENPGSRALMIDVQIWVLGSLRVLRKQWQGEFCRCSIDVVGGKQCDGGVDHLECFRHNAGPSPKAGKPMTQTTVDPLDRHRFILPDIVPPNRQERVVRRIIIGTVQLDAPGSQPLQQPVQRGGITTATFPVDEALARAIKSQPDPQLVLFF